MKSNIKASGQVKSLVVSVVPCVFNRADGVYATGGTDCYLVLLNAAALPADGAAVVKSIPVYNGTPFYMDFGDKGVDLSTGCVLAFSSTENTLTIMVAAGDKGSILTVSEQGQTVTGTTDVAIAADTTVQIATTTPIHRVRVTPTADGYVQFYDALPVSGTTPVKLGLSFPCESGVELVLNFGSLGITFQSGVWVAMSTEQENYTNAGETITGTAKKGN